jgi:poly(3-hydroxyalkanoate) synthetase
MAGHGMRPLLLDWGEPDSQALRFTLTGYLASRLEAVLPHCPPRFALIGYCMGGLLSLAFALRHPQRVEKIVLLASPWDFHAAASDAQRARLRQIGQSIRVICRRCGMLPVDVLQALLTGIDPFGVMRRYQRFATDDSDRRHFTAIEDWLNDGVPLSAPVALECLFDWYLHNTPGTGRWRIADQPVLPEKLSCPLLVVSARRDRIIPPASAQAVCARVHCAETHVADTGHIGMVAGRRSEREMWQPVVGWLQ